MGNLSARHWTGTPGFKCYNHAPYNRIVGWGKLSVRPQFTFTIVRNPWDRVLSTYHFWKQQDATHKFYEFDRKIVDYIRSNNMTFKQFVHGIQEKDPVILSKKHINPYIGYYFPGTGYVDYVGRFENLQQDFNTICDKIGIPRQQLPHINKSKHKHYTDYYDDDTKQIVADIYAKDIEYFGYEFE